jgi:hypothetical protein
MTIENHRLTVETFTVSWSLGGYRGSEKNDSFVSATIRCEPAADLNDLPLLQIKAALKVSAAVIQDAVARQAMSEDEARDRLKGIKENFISLEQAMLKAREKADAV